MSTIHCMKLNTKSQLLSGLSFLNTQNCKCWSCTRISSPIFVIKTGSKSWKRTQICCTLLLPRKNWKSVSDLKWERKCRGCNQMIVSRISLLMLIAKFSPPPDMVFIIQTTWWEREPGFFTEEFRCMEKLCLCSKTYCCYDVTSKRFKFNSKDLNKLKLEESGDGPLEKYRRVLNEKVNITSNKWGFRTNNHSVAADEQVRKVYPNITQNK